MDLDVTRDPGLQRGVVDILTHLVVGLPPASWQDLPLLLAAAELGMANMHRMLGRWGWAAGQGKGGGVLNLTPSR